MECLEVAIKKDELPFILTGLVYKNGLYLLERLLLTVSVLGFLLTLGEFLVGIFGPDEIWVSITGPSFTESLLLHPRLFASLGLVLAVGSRSLSVHISNTIHRSSQSYFMNRVSLVFKDANQPVDDLEVVYLQGGSWLVGQKSMGIGADLSSNTELRERSIDINKL